MVIVSPEFGGNAGTRRPVFENLVPCYYCAGRRERRITFGAKKPVCNDCRILLKQMARRRQLYYAVVYGRRNRYNTQRTRLNYYWGNRSA